MDLTTHTILDLLPDRDAEVEEILARCRGEIRKALKTETSTLPQWPAADAPPREVLTWLTTQSELIAINN